MKVPFNRPSLTANELPYIEQALKEAHLSAYGNFTKRCHSILEEAIGVKSAFLTCSGSAALEMAALLADIKAGDEVILPSFTFLTTASAFALRGAIPVFVDVHPENMNINEELVAAAIGPKTKAIVPVHYAGLPCNMDALQAIAEKNNLLLIEDAAHALHSKYKGQEAGSFGAISILSFHAAKNVNSGEGGALLVNDPDLIERAKIIWDKGTNKGELSKGLVSFYSWQALSSAFAPSEITAAFLLAQLEQSREITQERSLIWNRYHEAFETLEAREHLKRPALTADIQQNGHIYYLILNSQNERDRLIEFLLAREISALFHYVPLHLSPAGKAYGRSHGNLPVTEDYSRRLLRLPVFKGLDLDSQAYVCRSVQEFFSRN
ncbi:MAG: dTDP-4-amino-4,6-dideoxygalactose transaminase [Candidatus Obscuribacterales bacterium]|nr:dTDP-4-amino-4,6-dideoxygalactose transaminase [Candidatus Obscuribacterales bacterium]